MELRPILLFFGTGAIAGIILLGAEILRRRLGYGNEVARKLVHIMHGLCIAVWPFFVGYSVVFVVEALFVISIVLTHKLHWFGWLWKVGRQSWGEYFYPLGVVIAALLATSKWIFLVGVLELAIADAAAALIGIHFGRKNGYRVLGQKKSIAGSTAFFVTSLTIISLVVNYSPLQSAMVPMQAVFALAMVLACTENIGVYGLDNALLPVVSVAILNALVR